MIQQEIKQYWEGEAQSYSDSIKEELFSFKKQAWLDLIKEYAPQDEKMKILDIGTGPGFFPVILSEAGFDVTAIDCTENMLHEAECNLKAAGVNAELRLMDSHKLEFSDNEFDLIINRNVTWTLHDPKTAYREWYRVLKEGGRLMIFDSNFAYRFVDDELNKKYQDALKKAAEKGYERKGHVDQEESDRLTKLFYLTDKKRPQWDLQEFVDIGFKKIIMDQDIIKRVYNEKDMALWGVIPMFVVCGHK